MGSQSKKQSYQTQIYPQQLNDSQVLQFMIQLTKGTIEILTRLAFIGSRYDIQLVKEEDVSLGHVVSKALPFPVRRWCFALTRRIHFTLRQ